MPRPVGILASSLSSDPREAVRLARAAGFDGVQLPVTSQGLALQDLDRTGQRELLRVVGSQNLQLLSLATTCGRAGFSPGADIDRLINHLDRSLKSAADLGGVVLCVDLGPLPPPPAVEKAKPKPVDPLLAGAILIPASATKVEEVRESPELRDEPFETQLDAGLLEVGRLADRYSVRVAFRSELASLRAIQRALDATRCPLFMLDLDPVAILREGTQGWGLEQTLAAFAGRIAHLRVRDARRGAGGRTQAAVVDDGDTDFEQLLASLDSAGFDGPIVVDPVELTDRAAGAKAALGVLRDFSV